MLSVGLLCSVNSPVKPENNSEIIISYQELKYKCISSETIQTENITTGEIAEQYISKITKLDNENKNITATTDQKLTPGKTYIRIVAKFQAKSENNNNYDITKYSDYILCDENLTENITSEKEKIKQLCLKELKTIQSQPLIDSQLTSILNLLGINAIVIAIIVLIKTFTIDKKVTKAEIKNDNSIKERKEK